MLCMWGGEAFALNELTLGQGLPAAAMQLDWEQDLNADPWISFRLFIQVDNVCLVTIIGYRF